VPVYSLLGETHILNGLSFGFYKLDLAFMKGKNFSVQYLNLAAFVEC